MDDASHYRRLAACYARGALGRLELDDDGAIAAAEEAGLRMHRFKRTGELPRVRAVLGVLRGLAVTSLGDVGSGRGAFLWPLLDAMPGVQVTAICRAYRFRAQVVYCEVGPDEQRRRNRARAADAVVPAAAIERMLRRWQVPNPRRGPPGQLPRRRPPGPAGPLWPP